MGRRNRKRGGKGKSKGGKVEVGPALQKWLKPVVFISPVAPPPAVEPPKVMLVELAIPPQALRRVELNVVQLEDRPCDGCTACCTVKGVNEIGKPFYVKCVHELRGLGCDIYNDRPAGCRDWLCGYAMGGTPSGIEYRPDNLGVLFDQTNFAGDTYLTVFETRPGGFGEIEYDVREDVKAGATPNVEYRTEVKPGAIAMWMKPRRHIHNLIMWIMSQNDYLVGVRLVKYGTRQGVSYKIDSAVYPDEGDSLLGDAWAETAGRVSICIDPPRKQMVPNAEVAHEAETNG